MSTITRHRHAGAITKGTSARLWIAQALLAALFLFAGGMKLSMPADALGAMTHLPGLFMKFIAACEVLGALGLVAPGLLRIRPELTPAAALGLVIIMAGAVTITAARGDVAGAVMPLVVGLLAAYVARGRWHVAAHPSPRRTRVLEPATH